MQRAFAPAPARLGRIGQRIAQPCGFGADLFLPFAQRLDQPAKLPESIDAFLFQLANLRFIAGEPLPHRFKQRLDPRFVLFFGLGEPLLRTVQQGFLRLRQHLGSGVFEFLLEPFLRGQQQALLFLEIGSVGAQSGQFGAQFLTRLACRGQFISQTVHPLSPLTCPGQIADRGLEFFVQFARFNLALRQPRAQVSSRARAEQPTKQSSGGQRQQRDHKRENQ